MIAEAQQWEQVAVRIQQELQQRWEAEVWERRQEVREEHLRSHLLRAAG